MHLIYLARIHIYFYHKSGLALTHYTHTNVRPAKHFRLNFHFFFFDFFFFFFFFSTMVRIQSCSNRMKLLSYTIIRIEQISDNNNFLRDPRPIHIILLRNFCFSCVIGTDPVAVTATQQQQAQQQ